MSSLNRHEMLGALYLILAHASGAAGADIVAIGFAAVAVCHFIAALVELGRHW